MKKLLCSILLFSTPALALNSATLQQAVGQGRLLSYTTEEQGVVSFGFGNVRYREAQFAQTLKTLCQNPHTKIDVDGKQIIATHFSGDTPTYTLWVEWLNCSKVKQGRKPLIRFSR